MRKWFKEAMSENGVGSAKRLIGVMMTVVAMLCLCYLTINFGAVEVVESLLNTTIITGAALLGLYSITSIFKNNQIAINKEEKNKEE